MDRKLFIGIQKLILQLGGSFVYPIIGTKNDVKYLKKIIRPTELNLIIPILSYTRSQNLM